MLRWKKLVPTCRVSLNTVNSRRSLRWSQRFWRKTDGSLLSKYRCVRLVYDGNQTQQSRVVDHQNHWPENESGSAWGSCLFCVLRTAVKTTVVSHILSPKWTPETWIISSGVWHFLTMFTLKKRPNLRSVSANLAVFLYRVYRLFFLSKHKLIHGFYLSASKEASRAEGDIFTPTKI